MYILSWGKRLDKPESKSFMDFELMDFGFMYLSILRLWIFEYLVCYYVQTLMKNDYFNSRIFETKNKLNLKFFCEQNLIPNYYLIHNLNINLPQNERFLPSLFYIAILRSHVMAILKLHVEKQKHVRKIL